MNPQEIVSTMATVNQYHTSTIEAKFENHQGGNFKNKHFGTQQYREKTENGQNRYKQQSEMKKLTDRVTTITLLKL